MVWHCPAERWSFNWNRLCEWALRHFQSDLTKWKLKMLRLLVGFLGVQNFSCTSFEKVLIFEEASWPWNSNLIFIVTQKSYSLILKTFIYKMFIFFIKTISHFKTEMFHAIAHRCLWSYENEVGVAIYQLGLHQQLSVSSALLWHYYFPIKFQPLKWSQLIMIYQKFGCIEQCGMICHQSTYL